MRIVLRIAAKINHVQPRLLRWNDENRIVEDFLISFEIDPQSTGRWDIRTESNGDYSALACRHINVHRFSQKSFTTRLSPTHLERVALGVRHIADPHPNARARFGL